MKLTNPRAVLALLLAASAIEHKRVAAFVPSNKNRGVATGSLQARAFGTTNPLASNTNSFFQRSYHQSAPAKTSLHMASDNFNEAKYTEAAWSAIAALTDAADFYQAQTIEAPILLDVMLNPIKHNAGEDAEAAKRVVEKALGKAGTDVNELRKELEKYLSKQVRVSDGGAQKTMGRTLQKVLETARNGKEVLGVSFIVVKDGRSYD